MQTGLVLPKLACAVYSITTVANFIKGRKRAFYTVQRGRGRGGRHVQKVVKCIRERGACRERKEKQGNMFGEEGIMRTNTERKGYRACLQRGGT